jgi:DNA-binding transcriptional regulator YiaG
MKTWAEECKDWRHAHGISQREAAIYLMVMKATLEDWEQGRHAPSSKGPIRKLMQQYKREKQA